MIMFNKHTETRVETLIFGELRTAKEQHGESFNSLHEAYAVALEEMEEASKEVDMAKYRYEYVWNRIKLDEEKKIIVDSLNRTRINAVEAIKELAQFAAMIDKTLETLEKRKEAGTEKISVVQKGDKQ
jgi:hypothetical protein